jgi:hypothetical protein
MYVTKDSNNFFSFFSFVLLLTSVQQLISLYRCNNVVEYKLVCVTYGMTGDGIQQITSGSSGECEMQAG